MYKFKNNLYIHWKNILLYISIIILMIKFYNLKLRNNKNN